MVEDRLDALILTAVENNIMLPRILRLAKMISLSDKEVKALAFIILASTGHKCNRIKIPIF